jgi:hypothetical protein
MLERYDTYVTINPHGTRHMRARTTAQPFTAQPSKGARSRPDRSERASGGNRGEGKQNVVVDRKSAEAEHRDECFVYTPEFFVG